MAVKVTELVIDSTPVVDIMVMLIAIANDGEVTNFIVKAQGFGEDNKNVIYIENHYRKLSDAYLAYSKNI